MRRVIRLALAEVHAVQRARLKRMNRGGLKLTEPHADLDPMFGGHVAGDSVEFHGSGKVMLLVLQLNKRQIGRRNHFRGITPHVERVAAKVGRPVAHADHAHFRLPAPSCRRLPLQAQSIRSREEVLLFNRQSSRQQLHAARSHRPATAVIVVVGRDAVVEYHVVVVVRGRGDREARNYQQNQKGEKPEEPAHFTLRLLADGEDELNSIFAV